jgi:signal transduction histidine kinase
VLVLCGRKYAPLTVSVAAFLLLVVGYGLTPTSTAVQFMGMLVVFVVSGVVNRGRDLVVAGVGGFGMLVYGTFVVPTGGGWPDLLLSAVICEGLLVGGWLLTRRSREVDQLRSEAELAEERERLRTLKALAEQRARIARELHDVVSHGLSVVVVQTQAARTAVDDLGALGAADVTRHLDAVESTARDALGEMRRMLDLLQLDAEDHHGTGPEPPSPDLASLSGLVERARTAGLQVDAQLPEGVTGLGAGLELTVYRLVQESLTNAIKHAPSSPTQVQVRLGRGCVDVRVRSALVSGSAWQATGQNTGNGLVGMRERVRMYDGQLVAAPTEDGGFEVHAVLPVPTTQTLENAP